MAKTAPAHPKKRRSRIVHVDLDLTPALAEEFLANMWINRPLKPRQVDKVSSDLRAGRVQENGTSLKFLADGTMVDGQHRCRAVIRTGITMYTQAIYNFPKEAVSTIDTGAVGRTMADVFALRGYKNTAAIASMVKWVMTYLDRGLNGLSVMNVTTEHALEEVEKNPVWERSVRHCLGMRDIGSVGLFAALHVIFSEHDPDEADRFMNDLSKGACLDPDDPVYLLRERLIRRKRQTKKVVVTHHEVAAWTVKAWNARRDGRTIRVFRYSPGKESFPEIRS